MTIVPLRSSRKCGSRPPDSRPRWSTTARRPLRPPARSGRMPSSSIDGLAVQARLREDPALRDIPIIFLTANVQETARRRALAGGATGFLTKPYDARDLLDAVHRVVKGKAA
jgi:hypothetical protein